MPGDPITPRGKRMCWSIYKSYTHASLCLTFPTLLHPVFSSPSSFLFLGGLPASVGGLDFVACWLCLAPPGFMTKECNPPTPKAPVMMGGALPLASVEETRIFPMRVCTAEKICKVFSGNEGAEWTRWTQEPSLIGV